MDKLIITVNIGECFSVRADGREVNVVSFGGHCSGGAFEGDVLAPAADVQTYDPNGGRLSARYMLEGIDCAGQHCRIFIENNAETGEAFTRPRVLTDSQRLSWLNSEPLAGRIISTDSSLTIEIGRKKDMEEEI